MTTRSVPRIFVWLLVIAVTVGAGAALWQNWRSTPTSAAPGQDGWVSTKSGPLGPADRDLVIKVRLAGLWEHPVGQEITDRAVADAVRQVGAKISAEHLELDTITIGVARELGIVLPNQPSDQQRAWMSEISAQAGAAYDKTAVNRLRQAHGVVLPLLAQIRVSTRNETVRAFAQDATAFVTRHIGYLESTGLVDYDALPEAPAPSPAVVTPAGEYREIPVAVAALGIVLAAAVLIAAVLRLLPRRRAQSARPSRHVATRRADWRYQQPLTVRDAATRIGPRYPPDPADEQENAMIRSTR
jgi:hypothetical protein